MCLSIVLLLVGVTGIIGMLCDLANGGASPETSGERANRIAGVALRYSLQILSLPAGIALMLKPRGALPTRARPKGPKEQ